VAAPWAVCKRGRRQRLFSTAKEKRAPAPPLALLTPLSVVIIAQRLVKCKSKVSKLQYFFLQTGENSEMLL
jgi:hypothetical protein